MECEWIDMMKDGLAWEGESLGLVSFVFPFFCFLHRGRMGGKHSNDRARYREGQHYESFLRNLRRPVLRPVLCPVLYGSCNLWWTMAPAHSQARDSDLSSVCYVQSIRTVSNCVRRTLWSRRWSYFFFNSGECVCLCVSVSLSLWWALAMTMLRFPHLGSGNPPAQPSRPCKSAFRA